MSELSITPKAIDKIKTLATTEGIDWNQQFLRVAVVSGGCSGLTYDLGWDSVEQAEDLLLETHGVRVAMDLNAQLYIEGSTLDFTDGLEGKGFHFNNPQAVRNCACGESFSV
ncbi:MAG: iron-sulfur cluster assembly accessory protein [Bacteroidetes Order II. Incertae sedis bacterium]|nr:iron-sulfur cluster assembly accessory protein [Bacteroidetes Order II. bacterium]